MKTIIKLNRELIFRKHAEKYLVMLMSDPNASVFEAEGLYSEILSFLSDQKEDVDVRTLKEHLLNVYAVEEDQLENDLQEVLSKLESMHFIL